MAATAVIGIATPAFPQNTPDLQAMGAGMRQNQEMLRTFSWQSRVTFEVSGAQRRSDVYKVAYDFNGSLQRTQIGGESAKGKVRGPDGKKLSKKQLEAGRAFVLQASNQLDAYLNPLFAERAVATATATVDGNDMLLESHNVVHPGDTVTIVLSDATRLPRSLRATATIDGSPMQLDVTFGVLDFGPYHPAKSVTTTSWNGMPLTITTENSNYSE
jgi:hypothetical protein